jgi:hypothetical protein
VLEEVLPSFKLGVPIRRASWATGDYVVLRSHQGGKRDILANVASSSQRIALVYVPLEWLDMTNWEYFKSGPEETANIIPFTLPPKLTVQHAPS